LKLYAIIISILLVLIVITAVQIFIYLPELKASFEKKCPQILPLVNEKYLETLGCTEKYLANNTAPVSLPCKKSHIHYIWEFNLDKDYDNQYDFYGCINTNCCNSIAATFQANIDYLALFGGVTAFLGIISAVGSFYLAGLIRERGKRYFSAGVIMQGNHLKVFLLMLLLTIGLILSRYVLFPDPDLRPPFTKAVVSDNTQQTLKTGLSSFEEGEYYEIFNATIYENEQYCYGSCEDFYYYTTLQVQSGKIKLLDPIYKMKGITLYEDDYIESGEQKVQFRGRIDPTNQALKYFRYHPECVLSPGEFSIKIKGRVETESEDWSAPDDDYDDRRVLRDNEFVGNQDPFFDIFQQTITNIFQDAIDAKLEREQFQTVKGVIIEKTEGKMQTLEDVIIDVDHETLGGCKFPSGKSKENGIIEMKFRKLHTDAAYPVSLTLSKEGYQPILIETHIGGLPKTELTELGLIQLVKEGYTRDSISRPIPTDEEEAEEEIYTAPPLIEWESSEESTEESATQEERAETRTETETDPEIDTETETETETETGSIESEAESEPSERSEEEQASNAPIYGFILFIIRFIV
jgi:hypothetical protein